MSPFELSKVFNNPLISEVSVFCFLFILIMFWNLLSQINDALISLVVVNNFSMYVWVNHHSSSYKKFKHNSPFYDFPVVTVLFFVRLTSVTLKILSLKYNLVIADQILTTFFLIWKDIDSWLTDNSETLRVTIMTQ